MIVSRFDYTFNAASRTVSFGDKYRGLQVNQIALITNVTSGVVIYRFDTAALLGSLVGPDLTLVYDTTAMANDDDLQIIIDRPGQFDDNTLLVIKGLMEQLLTVNKEILEELQRIR